MNTCSLNYRCTDSTSYTNLYGSPEDIVLGISHLISTFAYDAVDTHDPDAVQELMLATIGCIRDISPSILLEYYEEDENSDEYCEEDVEYEEDFIDC